MFDLDAYLDRIGFAGTPDVAAVHRAHVAAIPFENLDPHRGVPVSLEPRDLQRKLVTERRGGYCFEQNLLLKGALDAIGARVEPMLARVRRGAPRGTTRPRSHLVLRVLAGDDELHADAGFGLGTLLEPIPFGAGGPYEQAGWRFRVVEDGAELVLQRGAREGWVDQYGFVPQPVPMVDLETSNWFTRSHPRSPFVTGLVVASQRGDGVRASLSDWDELALVEETPTRVTVTPISRAQVPELLDTRFGLPGFTLDQNGRVIPADQAAEASAP